MEGRLPKGIYLVLTNCTDSSCEADFNKWYNDIHLRDMVATRLVSYPTRYRNVDPQPGDARYLAIYEVERDEILEKMPDELTSRFWQRWLTQGRIHPALEVVDRQMWRCIRPAFRSPKSGRAKATGILAAQTNCLDPTQEEVYNTWYDTVHVPDILGTGLYHTAYRFEALSPQPRQAKYLALYETDAADPAKPAEELKGKWWARWKAAGRRTPLLDPVRRRVFQKVWPLQMKASSLITSSEG